MMGQLSHILLVEDEDIIAAFIEYTLGEQNIEVLRVSTTEAAWDILNAANREFGAIILDRQLPDGDGMALLRRIKGKSTLRDIPVIVETSVDEPEAIREGLAAGAYYYLTKPLEAKVLWAVIDAALAQRKSFLETLAAVREGSQAFAFLESGVFRFRTLAQATKLAQALARICANAQRVAMGLQELLVNSVEHGNLEISYAEKTKLVMSGTWATEVDRRLKDEKYANRWVRVSCERSRDHLVLTITDQGQGFDWARYLDFDPKRALDPHGRGIALARLSGLESLQYIGNGNTVSVTVGLAQGLDTSV